MKRSILLACGCVSMLLIAACGGNGGDQNRAPAKEVTVATNEADVQSVMSDTLSNAKISGQPCSLDSVDGSYASKVELTKGKVHVFRGWLANHARESAGKFIFVLSSDAQSFGIPASTGSPRPDVAEGEHAPALTDAGFNFSTTLSTVPAGSYQIRFLLAQSGGESYWCDAKKTVDIR